MLPTDNEEIHGAVHGAHHDIIGEFLDTLQTVYELNKRCMSQHKYYSDEMSI
jgi:hypothetical protein